MIGSTPPQQMQFSAPPPALLYMLRALAPSPGLRGERPSLSATWRDVRIRPRQLGRFLALSGLDATRGLPLLYPQVIGFRLNMVLLTHPRFPLPIWKALQTRNRIVQHAVLPANASYDLHTGVIQTQILEKGAEIELSTTMHANGALVWEAINTFYFRGRYGAAQPPPAEAIAPRPRRATMARWRTPSDVGWAMARLTGDFNGVHLWDAYARRFGFSRAFHHPQLVLAQCMAKLGADRDLPTDLTMWFQGPVPYGADVRLDAEESNGETIFALYAEGDRPGIVARLRSGSRS